MTVKELMENLKPYGPDTMVVVNGYEGGYEELKFVEPINIKLNVYRCKTDDPLDLEGNDEAESMNSCRGPHEIVELADRLEEVLKKDSWGMNPKHYNLSGEIVTAVVLPRGLYRARDEE